MLSSRKAQFLTLGAFCLSLILTGCGSSEDGPVLSDDEKLQRASKGRADYAAGMQGGTAGGVAPGATGSSAAAPPPAANN